MAPIEHTLADTEIGIAVGITTLPHLRNLAVVGPHRVTGVSDTVSRRRIFSCRPTTVGRRGRAAPPRSSAAWRRPRSAAPPSDKRSGAADALLRRRAPDRNFEAGVAKAVEAILASPQFLFRLEDTPATARPGQPYRLADVELASRLSFFVWGAGPDPALLDAAAHGRLSAPAARPAGDADAGRPAGRGAGHALRRAVAPAAGPRRGLARSDPLSRTTTARWRRRCRGRPSSSSPAWCARTAASLDLLTADYSFVNERVARHYGIPGVTGPQFRRVTLPEPRRGILGQGSVLTLTSIADRTSPVQRGKWIMEVLLGSPPPPPPPNVPALEETKGTSDGKVLSVRERMEEHRKNPACTSCHKVIDPLGLALEHFDATGRYRIKDNEVPVDAVGDLYDGTRMDGAAGLRSGAAQAQGRVPAELHRAPDDLRARPPGRGVGHAGGAPGDPPGRRRATTRISAFVQGVVATRSVPEERRSRGCSAHDAGAATVAARCS